jgi:D-glycero-alpha-D-manno-heptose-7-phosphate kinase
MADKRVLRLIHSSAPLRICDIGGWTDTWFARTGKVLNVAVSPPIEVEIKVFRNFSGRPDRVRVRALNYGETFAFDPDNPGTGPHALLRQAIASCSIPARTSLEISVHSPVPAGISTGTSASVCVALLGALGLFNRRRIRPLEIARAAHRVETERLGQQSGIQDQICAARGGISFIDMVEYPKSRVLGLRPAPAVRSELDRRIGLVYLGRPHRSSDLHERVIAGLERGGAAGTLVEMAALALKARDFLLRGDLERFGRAMSKNNELQRSLMAGLISAEADEVIRVARAHGASGWKVNGAGGRGGSVTVLAGPDDTLRLKMRAGIESLGRGIRMLPVRISGEGLLVSEIDPGRRRT